MKGKLYGIGIGPGDPELITLKAINIIKEVKVICVPKSGGKDESIALTIAGRYIDPERQKIVELSFPMHKERSIQIKAWQNAADTIIQRLREGDDVAFLTLGDPLFYSTFSYLIPFVADLMPDVEIKVIPGVSSINAASSSLLLPLAEADERVAIIPATYKEKEIRGTLEEFDTVVLMKVNRVIDKILDILDDLGLKENAIFVSRAGWEKEEIVRDLDNLKGKKLDYFSMVIVKKNM